MWKFRQVFETQNFERAEAVLNSKYSPHRMIALGNETRFRVFHGFSDVGGLSLHGLSYGPDMRAVTEPFKTYYLLTRVTRGRYRIQTGAQELILRPGQTAILDPFKDYTMDFTRHCEVQQLRIERPLFETALSKLLPDSVDHALEYDLNKKISSRHNERRANILRIATNELLNDEPGALSSMLRDQMIMLAAAAFLDDPCYKNKLLESQNKRQKVVMDALAYMEEHCASDIGVDDIVSAVGGSVRSLQNAFNKELRTTPLAKLKEIRLRLAYQDLKNGSQPASVTDVALKWGFNNLGRFAADFQRLYGTLPRDILRK